MANKWLKSNDVTV